MPKISALPPSTTLDGDDVAPIVDDSAATTKKFTLTLLKTWLQSLLAWVTHSMINFTTYPTITLWKGPTLGSGSGTRQISTKAITIPAGCTKLRVMGTIRVSVESYSGAFDIQVFIRDQAVPANSTPLFQYTVGTDGGVFYGANIAIHDIMTFTAGAKTLEAMVTSSQNSAIGIFDISLEPIFNTVA